MAPDSPEFKKIARRMANGSSAGPSGWTGAFILICLRDEVCRRGLATLVADICNHRLPSESSKFLLACNLTALDKGGNRVRPIAVGEVFYKLAAQYALRLVVGKVPAILAPLQQGVGEPGGCENIINTVNRLLLQNGRPRCALLVDFQNAFNSVSRTAVLRELGNHPALAPIWRISHWAYSTVSPLLTVDANGRRIERLASSQGVRQGDPLAPLLFALAAHPHYVRALQRARRTGSEVFGFAYLDDFTIVADDPATLQACAADLAAAAEDGLVWQPAKSALYTPGVSVDQLPATTRKWLGDSRLRHSDRAITLLGATLSTHPADVAAAAERIVEDCVPWFEALMHPAMPVQDALLLIRHCGTPKLNFMLRTTHPDHSRAAAAAFTELIHTAILRKLELNETELSRSATAAAQLFLPTALGGLGIPVFEVIGPFAWLGSQCAAAAFAREVIPTGELRAPGHMQQIASACSAARQHIVGTDVAGLLPEDNDLYTHMSALVAVHGPDKYRRLQHQLTQGFHRRQRDALLQSPLSPLDRARLLAVAAPGASAGFDAVPCMSDCVLPCDSLRISVRELLGLPPVPDGLRLGERCRWCGFDLAKDPYHCRSCNNFENRYRIDIHNGTVRLLQRAVVGSGNSAVIEPPSTDPFGLKRPDAEIRLGTHLYRVDVTHPYPLSATYVDDGKGVSMEELGAARKAAIGKSVKHDHIPIDQMVAYSVDTFGGTSDDVGFLDRQILKNYDADRATMLPEEVKATLKYGRRVQMMIASARSIIACFGPDRTRSSHRRLDRRHVSHRAHG